MVAIPCSCRLDSKESCDKAIELLNGICIQGLSPLVLLQADGDDGGGLVMTVGCSEPVMVKFADSGSSKKRQGQGELLGRSTRAAIAIHGAHLLPSAMERLQYSDAQHPRNRGKAPTTLTARCSYTVLLPCSSCTKLPSSCLRMGKSPLVLARYVAMLCAPLFH